MSSTPSGRPAAELSDAELEEQGTHAHATRNWVFLHGTAEQFAHHTERMLELEQEYLRRFPKRTWQGSAGTPRELDEAARLRLALRGIQQQVDALLAGSPADPDLSATTAAPDPAALRLLLSRVVAAGGRMHKLELHQAAREVGISPTALASLYKGDAAPLRAERDERVLTPAGTAAASPAGGSAAGIAGASAAGPAGGPGAEPAPLAWTPEASPRWDADKQRLFATVPAGVFDLAREDGEELLGEWWAARDSSGTAVGYGWMDTSWGGDVEVLLAVDGQARQRGVGTFILDRLEQEAAARGMNYVYNTVRETHPDRERLHDWLAIRGYRGSDRDEALRKRVDAAGFAPATGPAQRTTSPAPPPADPTVASGRGPGPGQEESGGYVDVEDHRY